MLQAMYNGVSAIQSTQQDMDVIGNNIANVDTTAYKSSDLTFADQLSQTLSGASAPTGSTGGTNPIQTGTGVRVASISTVDSQGSLLSTSSPTDMAVQGNGYFVLSSAATGTSYTRDGHFALDNNGNLVDASNGAYVLGWTASNTGTIDTTGQIGASSKIQIPIGNQSAVQATQNVTYSGNLDSTSTSTTPATATTNETVYDSLGDAHTVDITFTRGGTVAAPTNTWTWSATIDGGAAPTGTGTANQGTVTFDSNGNESAQTGSLQLTTANGAASPQAINVNFTAMTQVNTSSSVGASSQDGFPAGSLQTFQVDQNGVISGTFSNGLIKPLGQLAMASFTNPEGLNSVGDNEVTPSPNSGAPNIGTANTLGIGSIATGYLEQSNVDLGSQLSNMVVIQNAFEANTKIVSTVDQMLSALIQMKQ